MTIFAITPYEESCLFFGILFIACIIMGLTYLAIWLDNREPLVSTESKLHKVKVIKEVFSIEPIIIPNDKQLYVNHNWNYSYWDDIRSGSGDVFESDSSMSLADECHNAIKWAIDVKQEEGYSKEEVKKFVETELAIRKDEIRVTRVDVSDPIIQDYIESAFKDEEKDEEPTSRYITLAIPDSDLNVQVKLDDEGVVVDVYNFGKEENIDVIASTYKFYNELGMSINNE